MRFECLGVRKYMKRQIPGNGDFALYKAILMFLCAVMLDRFLIQCYDVVTIS